MSVFNYLLSSMSLYFNLFVWFTFTAIGILVTGVVALIVLFCELFPIFRFLFLTLGWFLLFCFIDSLYLFGFIIVLILVGNVVFFYFTFFTLILFTLILFLCKYLLYLPIVLFLHVTFIIFILVLILLLQLPPVLDQDLILIHSLVLSLSR